MAERIEIESCLRELSRPEEFNDYGPNGLQAGVLRDVARSACGAPVPDAHPSKRDAPCRPLDHIHDPA